MGSLINPNRYSQLLNTLSPITASIFKNHEENFFHSAGYGKAQPNEDVRNREGEGEGEGDGNLLILGEEIAIKLIFVFTDSKMSKTDR